MTILELREKRNTAWNAAKAFLDSHRTEKGTLTAEDDATYSRMEQEIADLGKEIARLERQEVLDAELSKSVNKPLTSKPVTAAEKPAKIGRASDEYKNGMLQALRTNFRQVSNILQEGDTEEQQTVSFTVRFCRKLAELSSVEYRVVFREKFYNIVQVDFADYGGKTILIKGESEKYGSIGTGNDE